MPSIDLFYTEGGSDKEYHIQLEGTPTHDNWQVAFQYGRRGSANEGGTKIQGVTEAKARKTYEALIRQKVGKGYTTRESGTPHSVTVEEAIEGAENVTRSTTYSSKAHLPMTTGRSPSRQMDSLLRYMSRARKDDPVMRDAEELLETKAEEPLVTVVGHRRVVWEGMTQAIPQELLENTGIPVGPSLLSQQPTPIEEDEVERLLDDDDWGMQDKYDGKHIMIRIQGGEGQAFNKKGQTSTQHGPVTVHKSIMDMVKMAGDIEVDGELIGQRYVVYDVLKKDSEDLRGLPYHMRHYRLSRVFLLPNDEDHKTLECAPLYTGAAKRARFNAIKATKGEGVVFKRLESTYTAGKGHADMRKFKFTSTCSCIVTEGRAGKRSVGLGLVQPSQGHTAGNRMISVGNCTIPNKKGEDGQLIPVPSVGSVVEIRYLYAYPNGSLYQPVYIGPRDDVDLSECLMNQLKYKPEG